MRSDPARIAILLLATLLAYVSSFHGVFQFDDYNVIVDNSRIHSLSAWWQHVIGIRPLLKLSYALNWISGLGVSGYHAVNLAIHCANAVLAYLLLKRFPASDVNCHGETPPQIMTHRFAMTVSLSPCSLPEGERDVGSLREFYANRAGDAAFIAALLFALLPVQTEAVTYISGRSVSFMALFYLAAMLAYAQGNRSNKVFSLLLFVAALLVKEVAVTLPLALLLWEKARGTSTSLAFRRTLPHWLLLALAGLLLLALRDYVNFFTSSFSLRSITDNLMTQLHAVTWLLMRLFALWGHNIDPDLPLIRHWTPLLLAEATLLAGLLFTGFRQNVIRPWLGFGILWLLLHLLPTNSLVPRLDVANERQLYLASIGACFMLANGFVTLRSSRPAWRVWLNVALTGWLVLLALATLSRNLDYRSEVALWEATVTHSPAKARPWNNLGYAHALAGDTDRARLAYGKAIHLKPDYALALQNLAAVEKQPGRPRDVRPPTTQSR
ncbi:MAG: hypothetical protein Q8O37_05100 [Sulfuricellaceae bacterium]|nr:hypothetical protein [Sulfuricellaceae bacterium]